MGVTAGGTGVDKLLESVVGRRRRQPRLLNEFRPRQRAVVEFVEDVGRASRAGTPTGSSGRARLRAGACPVDVADKWVVDVHLDPVEGDDGLHRAARAAFFEREDADDLQVF